MKPTAEPFSSSPRRYPSIPVVGVFIIIVVALFGFGLSLYGIYVILGMVLISRIMAAQSLAGIIETRTVSRKQIDAGESVTVSTEVKNNSASVVLWVLMEDYVRGRVEVEGDRVSVAMMRPGKVVLLKYQARLRHRGYYGFGPLLLESGDVFGLVRKFKVNSSVDYVTVLPKIVPISRYSIPTHRPIGEVRVQSMIFEDPSRLAGVRDYVPGDSLKRVHWKATARTGVLQSKVFDPTTMIGATIALDFHRNGWTGDAAFERSEFAVTAVASIAAFVLEQKQQIGILSNGRDAAERARYEREVIELKTRSEMRRIAGEEEYSDRLRPVELRMHRGDDQLFQMLVTLARLEMTDGLDFASMLVTEYHRLPRDAAFICVIGTFTRDFGEVLIEIKRSGFLVVVFVIDSMQDFAQTVAFLGPEGIQCGHLRNEQDLDQLAVMRM